MRVLVVVGENTTSARISRKLISLANRRLDLSIFEISGRASVVQFPIGTRVVHNSRPEAERLQSFRSVLRTHLEAALSRDPDLAFTKIAELNFADAYWKRRLESAPIIDVIRGEGPFEKIVFLGCHAQTVLEVKRGTDHEGVPKVRNTFLAARASAGILSSAIATFFINIVSDFTDLLYFRLTRNFQEKTSPKSPLHGVVWQSITGGWKIDGDNLAPKYAHLEEFKNLGLSRFLTASWFNNSDGRTPRKARAALRRALVGPDTPIDVCQYLTFSVFFNAYRPFLPADFSRRQLSIQQLTDSPLAWALTFRSLLLDLPKRKILENALQLFFENYSAKTAILFGYEFAEGRSVCKVAIENGLETIGCQHGASGPLHSLRMFDAPSVIGKTTSNATPKSFLLEAGPSIEVADIRSLSSVQIFLPARLAIALSAKPIAGNGLGRILVLLDMHDWKDLLGYILLQAGAISSSQILVRPHPSRRREVANFLSRISLPDSIRIDLTSDTLVTTVRRFGPQVAIVGPSGAGLELALAGILTLLFCPGNRFCPSPIADFVPGWAKIPQKQEPLEEMLSLLSRSAGTREEYSRRSNLLGEWMNSFPNFSMAFRNLASSDYRPVQNLDGFSL